MTLREMFNKLEEWKARDYRVTVVGISDGWVCKLETRSFYALDGKSDRTTASLCVTSKVCNTPEGAIENMASIVA